MQQVALLATISNRSSADIREALGQIEPQSESGRIFVDLIEHLQHVGEQQNVLQRKIDLHEQHSREWTSWQNEHDANLKGSVEQTRVASNRVHELESEGERLKRALQMPHDRATIRRDQRKALQVQVASLQGELREVKGDLREANDTIVLCDQELRAVRAERAKAATVVKLERSLDARSQSSTRKTRLR
jgi:chromosome segregation ATPase